MPGGGITLVRVIGQPAGGWTHFSAQLSVKGGWQVGSLNGPAATAGEIKAVLADLQEVLIRAEYVIGGEEGGLDNFQLFKRDPATAGDAAPLLPDAHATNGMEAYGMELGLHVDGFVL